jgi:hypothetical protein
VKYPMFAQPSPNQRDHWLASDIALTFPAPTGKLSIRPSQAFGPAL